MRAYSFATPSAEQDARIRPSPVRDGMSHTAERTVYQSGRVSPASAIAALTLAAAAFSSFQYFDTIASSHKLEHRLTVVDLADLAEPPPPPPPSAEKPSPRPADDLRSVQPKLVAPAPIVEVPAPAPDVAVAEAPAPLPPTPAARRSATVSTTDAPPAPSIAPTRAGDLSSKMISATPPTYPLESRRLREQGTVTLAVLLSSDGRVERLSVARSSGFPRLDRAASGAVRHWRWSPTVQDGQPVLVQGNVVIPFVLRS